VVRIYTYRSYHPHNLAGIQFLAVGHGSLWFLERRPGGVLRVSMGTGRPIGLAGHVGSCGEPCWQSYSSQSAMRVPTQDRLIRIDPNKSSG